MTAVAAMAANPATAAVTQPAMPTAWIDEIARDIYRINVAVPPAQVAGGFSFNQILVLAGEPLLFHTGPRSLWPRVRAQIEKLLPVAELRWVGFSHVEADECGAMREVLAAAPRARPLCGRLAAQLTALDLADVPPRALADGECIDLGGRRLRWTDTPHLPHGADAGYLFDEATRTLLCGDLFTQGGTGERPLVSDDILAAAEARRAEQDEFSHSPLAFVHLERLAALQPTTLACMHGSAWAGDGAALLRRLGHALAG